MLKRTPNLLGDPKYSQSLEKDSSLEDQSPNPNEIQLGQTFHNSDERISQSNIHKIQQKTAHSQYRADIDGLRTIAIGIVLIFHGFPDFMPGGFVGVDVFFVISGYLISGIIIKQAKKGKFSIVDFYERRVKRIYPALLLMMIFALIVSYKAYSYKQLKTVANTMAASSVFSANLQIMFHKQDYFDASQKQNAFLHLWSLGVEQQFYIVWPCLIAILLKRFRSITTILLTIFTLSSFSLGIFLIYDYPKIAFYLPFSRFWQMSIGGLIIYKNIKIHSKTLNDFLSIAGTVAILTVIWFVNEKSHFPGWWALIPTLSSACILMAGPEAFINKYILSSKPFVFIGKISYPLYLWHWPLMVFSRKLFPAGSTSFLGNMYFIIFLSFLLSVLTYYFVENKVRFRQEKKVVLILLIIMAILGLYAKKFIVDQDGRPLITAEQISPDLPIYQTDSEYVKMLKAFQKGLIPTDDDFVIKNGTKHPNSSKNPKRQQTSVQKLKAPQQYFELFEDAPPKKLILSKKIDKNSKYYQDYVPEDIGLFQVSNQGQENEVFIFGDSHARFLSVRFEQLYQESKKRNETGKFPTIVSLCHSAHAYLFDSAPLAKTTEMYRTFTTFFQRYFKQYKPKRILSMNRWLGYWKDCFPGCPPGKQSYSPEHIVIIKSQIDEFAGFMKELVDIGIEVTVATLHMDDDRLDPNKMYDASGVIEQRIKPVRYSEFRQKYAQVIGYFEDTLKKAGVKLIDIADNFCYEDRCEVLAPSGYPPYLDYNHFGLVYSRYWASSVDHLVDF